MANDVFISYASADRTWVVRLEASLTNLGQRVFLDSTRLTGGDPWEATIDAGLKDSRHIVVVWSKECPASPWVSREIATFQARFSDSQAHRVLFVPLDDTRTAYPSLQTINGLKGQYATGAASVDAVTWDLAVDAIVTALGADGNTVGCPACVLTLTERELDDVDWAAVAADLGVTRNDLKNRYGPTRNDWKPLDGSLSIQHLLAVLRDQLNGAVAPTSYKWVFPPDNFWSAGREAGQYAKRVAAAQLSLLVLDPISVYHRTGLRRLMAFRDLLQNDRTAISVLPPFSLDNKLTALRRALQNQASPYFEDYYSPDIPARRSLLATCSLPVADAEELERLLRVVAGHNAARDQKASVPEYLRQ